jgi:hypothetical protein
MPRERSQSATRTVSAIEAVDDARAGDGREVLGQPRESLGLVAHPEGTEAQAGATQGPRDDLGRGAELGRDIVQHAAVGGRGRAQHRQGRRELAQDRADAPVVGAEVVAPVGDAVDLVDDEEAQGAFDRGQELAQEALIAEALRGDEQDVHLVAREGLADRLPLVDVARVDGDRAEADAARHLDLVAHQGEERADDERRAVALVAADARGQPVDDALAPAGALDDEHARAVGERRLDRLALVGAERRVRAEHALQERVEVGGGRGMGSVGHRGE